MSIKPSALKITWLLHNGVKTITRIVFRQMVQWISTCKRMGVDPYLTPYTDVNSKWIIGLNIKAKTIKLLEENRSKSL